MKTVLAFKDCSKSERIYLNLTDVNRKTTSVEVQRSLPRGNPTYSRFEKCLWSPA